MSAPETKGRATRRYNLNLPEELYDELQIEADKRHTTVVELIRRSITLALMAIKLEDDPNSGVIIRRNGADTKVVLL